MAELVPAHMIPQILGRHRPDPVHRRRQDRPQGRRAAHRRGRRPRRARPPRAVHATAEGAGRDRRRGARHHRTSAWTTTSSPSAATRCSPPPWSPGSGTGWTRRRWVVPDIFATRSVERARRAARGSGGGQRPVGAGRRAVPGDRRHGQRRRGVRAGTRIGAAMIDDRSQIDVKPWVKRYPAGSDGGDARATLVFPHAGGAALAYRSLGIALAAAGSDAYVMQYPQRGDRLTHPAPATVGELAADLFDAGDWAALGHCGCSGTAWVPWWPSSSPGRRSAARCRGQRTVGLGQRGAVDGRGVARAADRRVARSSPRWSTSEAPTRSCWPTTTSSNCCSWRCAPTTTRSTATRATPT